MKIIDCKCQAELDAALKLDQNGIEIRLMGSGIFEVYGSSTVTACGSSTVTAYGSSTVTACDSSTVRACDSSTVRACGSSTVRACGSSTVTAYDSSTVRACGSSMVRACGSSTVMACDSSTVRAYGSSTVTAYDSSTVRACGSSTVTACDSSTVTACGSSTVRAGKHNAVVMQASFSGKVSGGIKIRIPAIKTLKQWLENYALKSVKGFVTLYKGVSESFMSQYNGGISYAPGTQPEAADWDGGKAECGGGLHFCPTPAHCLDFAKDAKKFVACKIAVKDIAKPKPNAMYPSKIKARRVVECIEVDINGKPVGAKK